MVCQQGIQFLQWLYITKYIGYMAQYKTVRPIRNGFLGRFQQQCIIPQFSIENGQLHVVLLYRLQYRTIHRIVFKG